MLLRALAVAAGLSLLSLPAAALPMVSVDPMVIPLGETLDLDLILDPETVRVGAYSLKFSVSSLSEVGVGALVLDPVPECEQSKSGPDTVGDFSVGGECVDNALESDTVLAHVTVTGLVAGGELRLDLSNVTDFDTFGDIPVVAMVLAVVTPEPGTAALLGWGVLGLALVFSRESRPTRARSMPRAQRSTAQRTSGGRTA